MFTDIKVGKRTFYIATQQYVIGLYVAVYENNRIYDQFSLNITEAKFHKKVREGKFF